MTKRDREIWIPEIRVGGRWRPIEESRFNKYYARARIKKEQLRDERIRLTKFEYRATRYVRCEEQSNG